MENMFFNYSGEMLKNIGFSEVIANQIAEVQLSNDNYSKFTFCEEKEGSLEKVIIDEEVYFCIGKDVLNDDLLISNNGEIFIYNNEQDFLTFVNSSLKCLVRSMDLGDNIFKEINNSEESLCNINMQEIETFEKEIKKIDEKALSDDDNYWIYEIESMVKLS